MPVLTVFAGPNGSRKSSLIRQVEFEGRQNLLEPDAIARRIRPESPRQAGISEQDCASSKLKLMVVQGGGKLVDRLSGLRHLIPSRLPMERAEGDGQDFSSLVIVKSVYGGVTILSSFSQMLATGSG